jgi:hypothetical protein
LVGQIQADGAVILGRIGQGTYDIPFPLNTKRSIIQATINNAVPKISNFQLPFNLERLVMPK